MMSSPRRDQLSSNYRRCLCFVFSNFGTIVRERDTAPLSFWTDRPVKADFTAIFSCCGEGKKRGKGGEKRGKKKEKKRKRERGEEKRGKRLIIKTCK